MNRLIKINLLAFIILLSCGDEEKDSSNTEDNDLLGVWKTECLKLGEVNTVQMKATFVNDTVVIEITTFGDDVCVIKTFYDRIESKYKIGSTIDNGLTEVDFTRISHTKTANLDISLEGLNSSKIYGYDDWSVNTSKDIAGRSYTEDEDPEIEFGGMLFSVYQIKNDVLYIGDNSVNKGRTVEERSSTLSDTRYLRK